MSCRLEKNRFSRNRVCGIFRIPTVLFFVGTFAGFLGIPTAIRAQEADILFQEAIGYIERGEYAPAMRALNGLIREDDTYVPAYYQRGLIFFKKGLNERALDDFNRAVQLDPAYARAYVGRALVLLEQGKWEQILSALDKAIALDPGLGIAYYNRGIAYYRMEDFNRALDDLERAKALGFEVREELITEVRAFTDLDRVIAEQTLVIESGTREGIYYYNRSVAYYYRKEFQKSLKDLKRAAELGYHIPAEFMEELRSLSEDAGIEKDLEALEHRWPAKTGASRTRERAETTGFRPAETGTSSLDTESDDSLR